MDLELSAGTCLHQILLMEEIWDQPPLNFLIYIWPLRELFMGKNDQSNTLTSAATGWTANLNMAATTYGSDGSITDAELLGIDDGATTELPVGGGAGSAMVWTTATGTGAPVRAGVLRCQVLRLLDN